MPFIKCPGCRPLTPLGSWPHLFYTPWVRLARKSSTLGVLDSGCLWNILVFWVLRSVVRFLFTRCLSIYTSKNLNSFRGRMEPYECQNLFRNPSNVSQDILENTSAKMNNYWSSENDAFLNNFWEDTEVQFSSVCQNLLWNTSNIPQEIWGIFSAKMNNYWSSESDENCSEMTS